jgi:hypothetical protein
MQTIFLQDFSKDTRPVSFFIFLQSYGRGTDWQNICLDNGRTNERLMVKTTRTLYIQFVLIFRYPLGANQEWIEAKEQEIMGWYFRKQNRRIHFEQNLGQNDDNV